MKRFKTEKIEGHVDLDLETGEIKSLYKRIPVKQDTFIQVYSACMAGEGFLGNLTRSELKVLVVCWRDSNPASTTLGDFNKINNDTSFKESVRESAPTLDNKTINNIMSALVRKGYLIRLYKGEFALNPTYFIKGKIKEDTKLELLLTTKDIDE